jgi:hypothetical protein
VAGSTSRRSFKREQTPQDLVGTLVFLASKDSDVTTGQTFVVDGEHPAPAGRPLVAQPGAALMARLHALKIRAGWTSAGNVRA